MSARPLVKLTLDTRHGESCQAESKAPFTACTAELKADWFLVRLKKKKKKSSLTGCQKLVKILLRKTQPHLSGIKGNLLWTSVGCSSSAGILRSLLSTRKHSTTLHKRGKKKTHPPTNNSWWHSNECTSTAGFVTLLPLAWQRTDTLSELWYQLWTYFTNPSKPLFSIKQETYNQPIFHHTTWQQLTPLGTERY